MKKSEKYYYLKKSLKVINLVLIDIDQHEKEIVAVDYINNKIETKDKWNQMNILDMQSMLGTNFCMPLLHISKRQILLEETNQRINEFYIGYMMNPTLYRNRAFKYQMKLSLKHTFGPDTNSHISKTLQKPNTIVLALVIFYESEETIIRKLLRVLSCVIYTIINKYVCINYFSSEKSKLSDLKIGCTGSSKHNGMDYNNVLGIGITDILLNFLSCHGFLKNNDFVVILKCPNRMSEYYFNKGFIELECDEDH